MRIANFVVDSIFNSCIMKKSILILLSAIAFLCSCQKEKIYTSSDLYGIWNAIKLEKTTPDGEVITLTGKDMHEVLFPYTWIVVDNDEYFTTNLNFVRFPYTLNNNRISVQGLGDTLIELVSLTSEEEMIIRYTYNGTGLIYYTWLPILQPS